MLEHFNLSGNAADVDSRWHRIYLHQLLGHQKEVWECAGSLPGRLSHLSEGPTVDQTARQVYVYSRGAAGDGAERYARPLERERGRPEQAERTVIGPTTRRLYVNVNTLSNSAVAAGRRCDCSTPSEVPARR